MKCSTSSDVQQTVVRGKLAEQSVFLDNTEHLQDALKAAGAFYHIPCRVTLPFVLAPPLKFFGAYFLIPKKDQVFWGGKGLVLGFGYIWVSDSDKSRPIVRYQHYSRFYSV